MLTQAFKILLRIMKVQYGRKLRLRGLPVILKVKGAQIKIGDGCTINSSFWSNLMGLYSRTVIVARCAGATIEIGDHVGISGAAIYARKGIHIGSNTAIGANAKILDNDFHPVDRDQRIRLLENRKSGGSDLIPSKPIWIGKDCWIGCNSIILKGTVLGDGCVVGAGAVVCGTFEANSVIAGNPAKSIKRLDTKEP